MRWKVKRSAVMRKGLVCPVLCKFTGSSGLSPQSEVRQPDTHLFSPAFIYLLSFFDSAVSLSISVCVCLSPGSFFYSDSGMNNSKWLGKFTWRLNYHLCFSSGVFSPYPLLLLSLPLLLLGWFSHHCFLTPSYRSKLPQWSVSQYMMSSASLSHLFKLWQLQSSHASLDAHTSTLQTLWNSRVENKQV